MKVSPGLDEYFLGQFLTVRTIARPAVGDCTHEGLVVLDNVFEGLFIALEAGP